MTRKHGESAAVQAAGAVVWRQEAGTGTEVLLIHRPKYDDWSLPKGKLERGEHPLSCAVREVEEETGHRIRLDRPLPLQSYRAGGRPKQVHYWTAAADPAASPRTPDAEVDQVRFLPVAEAIARLTHRHDADLLVDLLRAPLATRTVVVLRHAKAADRRTWPGDDRDRPLDARGAAAARRLVPALAALGVTSIASSPATRCRDTVAPLATRLGLEVETDDGLSEEAFDADDGSAVRARAKAALDGDVVLLCTHRPVLPGLLTHVGASAAIRHGEKLSPGEFVVVNHHEGTAVASRRYQI